jgi:polar amino acid transport system substrate-binding protein
MNCQPIGRVLVLLVALGLPVPAFAAGVPMTLGYAEFPPFTYTDSEGKPQGSLIEMVEAVAADAGIDLGTRAVPPTSLYPGIADGTLDLFMGVTTPPEFQGTTLAGESVIARIELDVYAMDETPVVTRMEDLVGRTVIVHAGYSYAGWRSFLENPANRVTLVAVDSAERGLSALRNRPTLLLLEYTLPMKLALAGRIPPNLKSTPISVVDAHFVVSKKTPDAAALLARLERSFQRLRSAGSLP